VSGGSIIITANTVNATVDMWSDRQMRGYMATTVHYIKRDDYSLKSGLLAIVRFTGSHTGECIGAAFETVVHLYGIRHKIDHIVTDDVANMRKVFNVCFSSMKDDNR